MITKEKVLVHLGSIERGCEATVKFSELLPRAFGPKNLLK